MNTNKETNTFAPIDGEMWKRINDKYYLSNFGRWYSVKMQKEIKQRPNMCGYMRAYAMLDGRKETFTHIEVVRTFGDRFGYKFRGYLNDNGLSIDHVDGNKLNNCQSNHE